MEKEKHRLNSLCQYMMACDAAIVTKDKAIFELLLKCMQCYLNRIYPPKLHTLN